jgi:diguanylate cyclase (GGDEF)-like protein
MRVPSLSSLLSLPGQKFHLLGLSGRLRLLLAVIMVPSLLLLVLNANQHRIDVMHAVHDQALYSAELAAISANAAIPIAARSPPILMVGLARPDIADRTIRHMVASIVLAIFVLGAAIFTVGWLADLRVLRPMQALTLAATRLSGGNLDARADLSRIPMKEMRVLAEAFNTMAQSLQHLALRDGLTGIANRRQFDLALDSEVQRANRIGKTLSLLMIDADYFKSFNDHYGHVAGDACLRRIAEALHALGKRPADLVARYGGEEFVILLPDTDQAAAFAIALGLLNAVRALALPHAAADRGIVTISIGMVTLVAPVVIVTHTLIELADQALYAAKVAGRDRIVVSDGQALSAE